MITAETRVNPAPPPRPPQFANSPAYVVSRREIVSSRRCGLPPSFQVCDTAGQLNLLARSFPHLYVLYYKARSSEHSGLMQSRRGWGGGGGGGDTYHTYPRCDTIPIPSWLAIVTFPRRILVCASPCTTVAPVHPQSGKHPERCGGTASRGYARTRFNP